jgi:hypothetical protein
MTAKDTGGVVMGTVIAVMMLIAAAQVQGVRDDRYPGPRTREGSLYITSDSAIHRLSVGYRSLAADLYWIRTIQYYGGIKRRLAESAAGIPSEEALPTNYDLLYPLLNITTTLDPRLNIAYRFGSIFLAEPFPGGAGRPDLAIELLQKGARERPERWEYLQDIGFVHYWWLHDFEMAAKWFNRAADVEGAPWWLRSLAATTMAEGGDRDSSRTIWESLVDTPDNEWLRNDARKRLRQLDAMDFIDDLQARVDQLIDRIGRPPTDWGELVRAGLLSGIPVDSNDKPYLLDTGGRVHVSPESDLFPLPDEPKQLLPGAR